MDTRPGVYLCWGCSRLHAEVFPEDETLFRPLVHQSVLSLTGAPPVGPRASQLELEIGSPMPLPTSNGSTRGETSRL